MQYVIYLGYNGNYYGKEYVIGKKKYAHETSKSNAKRYDTAQQAKRAIKHFIRKCANIDKTCELSVEEVKDNA